MMVCRIISGMILGLVLFSSCYYDVEETLYASYACQTTDMSYQADINPILERYCFSCHSAATNNGNVTLEGYTHLTPYLANGKLLGAIRHQSGFVPMPQNGPQLSTCNVARIEQWIADGYPNN